MTPYNALTGKPYAGGNVSRLAASEMWAGYGQWRQLGLQVKRGATGTRITVLITVKDPKTGTLSTKPRAAIVFSREQVEPITQPMSATHAQQMAEQAREVEA